MAFYRIENGEVTKAEGPLFGPGYDLLADQHDTYAYPVDGWYWFDSDEDASSFFGVEIKIPKLPSELPII